MTYDAAVPVPRRPPGQVTAVLAAYVVLWLVEGAFRKWVPGTSLAFYVLRDVYAVAALAWLASSRSPSSRRVPWWATAAFALLGIELALQYALLGSTAPVILLFGLRSYVAPFLFAVLCGKYANGGTLDRLAAFVTAAVPLELALTVLQVLAPPTALINTEVGGDPNLFVNGGQVVRATGTFAAPLGLTVFLLIALAIGLWWTMRTERRSIGWAVVASVLTTVALSGARGAVLNSALLLIAYLVYSVGNPTARSVPRVVGLVGLLGAALLAVQLVLPEVLASFVTRFTDASASEDSSSRLIDWFAAYLGQIPTPLGDGMGARSNAGIALGSSSDWIENDSLRWVAELGDLGYMLSLFRSVVAVALLVQTIVRLRQDPPVSTLLRVALVVLLALGSVNETPMSEGGFGILLGCYLLSIRRDREEQAAAPLPAHETEMAFR